MNRLPGVDLLRILGILAVITIHAFSYHFQNGIPRNFNSVEIIYVLVRFAVPYFFVTSGYFWGRKIVRGADPLQTSLRFCKRILIIFIVWSLIYLLPHDLFEIYNRGFAGSFQNSIERAIFLSHHPLWIALSGTATHLWFLPSLLICVVVCTCFLMMRQVGLLMVFSTGLYVAGVLSNAYLKTPIGFHLPFDTTRGPCLGVVLFASGYLLSTRKINPSWLWKGCLILIAGLVLQFLELIILRGRFGIISLPDYVFGTYFLGLGCCMIAVSIGCQAEGRCQSANINESNRTVALKAALPWSQLVNTIGQLTLGIYAIHLIFVENLSHFRDFLPAFLWDVGFTPFLFILSGFVVYLMSKSRILRPIVV
jgi:surface polysaccharide O-acyltransferase-like enzyme